MTSSSLKRRPLLRDGPREDEIYAEMLKSGGGERHEHIHFLVIMIWQREETHSTIRRTEQIVLTTEE